MADAIYLNNETVDETYQNVFKTGLTKLSKSNETKYLSFAQKAANQLINSPKLEWSPHIGGWYYVNMVPGTWRNDFLKDDSDIAKYPEIAPGAKELMARIQPQMGHLIKEIDPTKLGIDYETISGRTRNIHIPTKLMPTGDFSITFKDNRNLDVFRYHKFWYQYMQAYRKGYIRPNQDHKTKSEDFFTEVPYLNAIWIVLFKPFTFDLMGLVKIMGVSPLELPLKDVIGERSNHQLTTYSLSYKAVDTIAQFYGDSTPSGNLYNNFLKDQESFFDDLIIQSDNEEEDIVSVQKTIQGTKENLQKETESQIVSDVQLGKTDNVTKIHNTNDQYNDLIDGLPLDPKEYEVAIHEALTQMRNSTTKEEMEQAQNTLLTKISGMNLTEAEQENVEDLFRLISENDGHKIIKPEPKITVEPSNKNSLQNDSLTDKPFDPLLEETKERIKNDQADKKITNGLIEDTLTTADVRKISNYAPDYGVKYGTYNGPKGENIPGFSIATEFGVAYDSTYDIKIFNPGITLSTAGEGSKEIKSSFSGKIVYSKDNITVMENRDGLNITYMDMDTTNVKSGDIVKVGDTIGSSRSLTIATYDGGKHIDPSDVLTFVN